MVFIYSHGRFIGVAQSDNTGSWSFTPTQPLNYGGHSLSVMSQGQMSDTFPVVIESQPVQPVNPLPTPDPITPPAPKAATIGSVKNVRGEQNDVPAGGTTDGNFVIITGTAPAPYATVQVFSNGQEIARVFADSEGN